MINSPTNITTFDVKSVDISEVNISNQNDNPFADFNDLRNIYVDSHMISELNLSAEHIDKIEIQRKETMQLSPLKDENIDFEKDVKEFSKDTILKYKGDLAFTQANTKPQKVEELLV
jgi:hypothetical protein